jgi:hypothetical protein
VDEKGLREEKEDEEEEGRSQVEIDAWSRG